MSQRVMVTPWLDEWIEEAVAHRDAGVVDLLPGRAPPLEPNSSTSPGCTASGRQALRLPRGLGDLVGRAAADARGDVLRDGGVVHEDAHHEARAVEAAVGLVLAVRRVRLLPLARPHVRLADEHHGALEGRVPLALGDGQAVEQRERRARVDDLPAAPGEHARDGVGGVGAGGRLGDAALEGVGAGGMVVAESEQAGGDLGARVGARRVAGAAQRGERARRVRAEARGADERGVELADGQRRTAGGHAGPHAALGQGAGDEGLQRRGVQRQVGLERRRGDARQQAAGDDGRDLLRRPRRRRRGAARVGGGGRHEREQGSSGEGESSHRLDIDWRVRPLEPGEPAHTISQRLRVGSDPCAIFTRTLEFGSAPRAA